MATKSEIAIYRLFKKKDKWLGSSEIAMNLGISKGASSRLLKGFGSALQHKKVDKSIFYKPSDTFADSDKVKDIIETMEIMKNDCK